VSGWFLFLGYVCIDMSGCCCSCIYIAMVALVQLFYSFRQAMFF
jgi:hypothetical protein